MNLNEPDVYCIFPEDRTTFFLNRIVTYLKRELGDKFHCFKVKLNDKSHNDCLSLLKEKKGKLILFLGHGRSDMLYGACGDEAENLFSNSEAEHDNPSFFKKTEFITIENCSVFSQNIVISLSCNSNVVKKSIGQASVRQGALSFVGFGDIQTDYLSGDDFTLREISIFKGILVSIIKKSISYCYKNSFNPERFVDVIKIITNRELYKLITKSKGVKFRHRIARHLYNFKTEIQIFGDYYAKIT